MIVLTSYSLNNFRSKFCTLAYFHYVNSKAVRYLLTYACLTVGLEILYDQVGLYVFSQNLARRAGPKPLSSALGPAKDPKARQAVKSSQRTYCILTT